MTVGILALQGCVEPHVEVFRKLGVEAVKVRLPAHLDAVTHLVLPGGESTTMLKLLHRFGLFDPLCNYFDRPGRRMWGICAGSILMAKRVEHPKQESLNLVDVSVVRNAYGRQNESFIAPLDLGPLGVVSPTGSAASKSFEAVFIRAPQFSDIREPGAVTVVHKDAVVLVRTTRALLTSFHPELTDDTALHELFLSL